jgi:hypothetical protein
MSNKDLNKQVSPILVLCVQRHGPVLFELNTSQEQTWTQSRSHGKETGLEAGALIEPLGQSAMQMG